MTEEQKRLVLTLPIVPSVNNCYRNISIHRRILTAYGKAWKEEVQLLAKMEAKKQGWEFVAGKKLVMELRHFWPDHRRRDPGNSHKLLPDSLEGVLFDDDRWLLIRDIDFAVDKSNPRVEVVLYPL